MKDATYISVLLDRSGSMQAVRDETISGFNQFIKDQKEQGENATLTLVQFDTQSIDTVHENKPIKEVPDLTPASYVPRASTPLLDALGDSIDNTGKVLRGIPEESRPDKIVFVIITDGLENSSRRHTKAAVCERIKHQADVYKWNFVYLGANQDAFDEAAQIGIAAQTVSNYTGALTKNAFRVTSANIRALRSTGSARSLDYSDAQRKSMTEAPVKESQASGAGAGTPSK